jgi:2-polyprenyl-3-methyl-5-hydroxy-6-metoxy-1,4-benzoquinol methylase
VNNPTVEGFYDKSETYAETYALDHLPRIQAMFDRYGLRESLKGKRLLDVGGGQGLAGTLLDPSTDYWVIDGADIKPAQRLCKGTWHQVDLDYHTFGSEDGDNCLARKPQWDAAFCLEVLEHLPGIYNCVAETKKLVKRDGDIFISVPTEEVWHNAIFPSLLWPPQNFLQWLRQMALPLVDPARDSAYIYRPTRRGWPAYQFRCRNADWTESEMLFKKDDPKFYGKTPQEYCNL